MAEYQNIFTQVQIRGPGYAGVPLDGPVGYRVGQGAFSFWLGKLGDAQVENGQDDRPAKAVPEVGVQIAVEAGATKRVARGRRELNCDAAGRQRSGPEHE